MDKRFLYVALVLATVAVVIAVVVLASWLGTRTDESDHTVATATPTASRTATEDAPPPTARLADIPVGSVTIDQSIADLAAEPAIEADQTIDGGVKAFVESALWVLASPAAEADPMNAPAAISDVIGTTDAEILGRFDRTGGVDFLPLDGAYRVLGHSGDQAAPEAVMVEVAAPMTISSGTRWLFVGGVITWTDDGWQISSIKPTETGQPTSGATHLGDFTDEDRLAVLTGLGWTAFANGRR
ncbi:hypothetical protein QE364_000088 [Nocardioides zeae]|uniref:Uncharacterized protein n=1 Tax=Nocardioides zeae TaxID=1457234 RepID=A0ACC6ICG2_9ACTN|nr:hypothetical protein [Nocardioides zeae]MDR6208400.1 hypothetical protein [Nocardioides zeae]